MIFAIDHDHPNHSIRQSSSKTDPSLAYRSYLDAIARRDIDAVLDALTEEHGQQLRDLRRSRDFSAFFELWCENQSEATVVIGSVIKADHAIVQARSKAVFHRIGMRWMDGRWRIASERHVRVDVVAKA